MVGWVLTSKATQCRHIYPYDICCGCELTKKGAFLCWFPPPWMMIWLQSLKPHVFYFNWAPMVGTPKYKSENLSQVVSRHVLFSTSVTVFLPIYLKTLKCIFTRVIQRLTCKCMRFNNLQVGCMQSDKKLANSTAEITKVHKLPPRWTIQNLWKIISTLLTTNSWTKLLNLYAHYNMLQSSII